MKPLRDATRSAITRRALRDKGGLWAGLAVVWYGGRFLARLAARDEQVVDRRELRPGEAVTITHTTVSRRQAARNDKADAKAAKQAKKAARHAKRDGRGTLRSPQ